MAFRLTLDKAVKFCIGILIALGLVLLLSLLNGCQNYPEIPLDRAYTIAYDPVTNRGGITVKLTPSETPRGKPSLQLEVSSGKEVIPFR